MGTRRADQQDAGPSSNGTRSVRRLPLAPSIADGREEGVCAFPPCDLTVAYRVRVDDLLVASSASVILDGKRGVRPVGIRHAYRDGAELTLCGRAVRYLFRVENAKWSVRTPQRCAACESSAITD